MIYDCVHQSCYLYDVPELAAGSSHHHLTCTTRSSPRFGTASGWQLLRLKAGGLQGKENIKRSGVLGRFLHQAVGFVELCILQHSPATFARSVASHFQQFSALSHNATAG